MSITWVELEREIEVRFETLAAAGVVSDRARRVARVALGVARRRLRTPTDTDGFTMFATHIVMALERAAKGVTLDPVEVPADDLARLEDGLTVADEMMDVCRKDGLELPDGERILIALHITAMTVAAATG